MEYYVVRESSKGKLHDRALHIKVLPPGSVQLESTLTTAVQGIVVDEPTASSQEHPGVLRLLSPIPVEGRVLETIELWPRCCPEGLVLRTGDLLVVDVTHYRPENLYFARNVHLKSFRKIGREFGKILRLKDQGFGFLHSSVRAADIYFRTNEVVGADGLLVKENDLEQDVQVSYDVITEPGKSGGGAQKFSLRAIRLHIDDADDESNQRTILKQSSLLGVVTREAKKDVRGLLRSLSDLSNLSPSNDDLQHDLIEALDEFVAHSFIKEVKIVMLAPAQRHLYYSVLESRFPGLAYEKIEGSSIGGESKAKTIRIWKLNPAEYAVWQASVKPKDDVTQAVLPAKKGDSHQSEDPASASSISFLKSDTDTKCGPILKDLEVTFDLYIDRRTCRLVARHVALTDRPAVDMAGLCMGVMDISRPGKKSGSIRCLGTDERIFWNSSSDGSVTGNVTQGVFEDRMEVVNHCNKSLLPLIHCFVILCVLRSDYNRFPSKCGCVEARSVP